MVNEQQTMPRYMTYFIWMYAAQSAQYNIVYIKAPMDNNQIHLQGKNL